jgi:hypothetical protein
MGVKRLDEVQGFNIDRVAAAADDDPDVLRLENLDSDLRRSTPSRQPRPPSNARRSAGRTARS